MLIVKKPTPVQAFVLGSQTDAELDLIQKGMLSLTPEGQWRLITRETPGMGELVETGDYVKIDSIGMPYPVSKQWFEDNHELIRDGWYLQKTAPRKGWHKNLPMLPEVRYLLDQKLLVWNNQHFSAFLWGTMQTVTDDAVIVLDAVIGAPDGTFSSVEFHFVAAEEFAKTYNIISPENK